MSISVLMSVYKSEKPDFLDRSLHSVWTDQTLKPDQVVLVKDGPLGKELETVITRWKNELGDKMTLVVNEQNLGLTKSLNKGLQVASGDFIARMDSDDISLPDRFKHQVSFLNNHPDVDIVGGRLQEFNGTCDNLGVRKYPLTNEDVLNYIYKASPLAHPTVMMRRKMFEEGLHYDERFRTSQDIALWYDALVNGYHIANLDEVTIKFRRDDDVFQRRSRSKAKNELKIYCKGIRRIYGLISWRYAYPIARYIFRMMPVSLVKAIYGSSVRKRILQ